MDALLTLAPQGLCSEQSLNYSGSNPALKLKTHQMKKAGEEPPGNGTGWYYSGLEETASILILSPAVREKEVCQM